MNTNNKLLLIALACFTLTGCVSSNALVNGVLGRYPHFDSNEYALSVGLEYVAKLTKNDRNNIPNVLSRTDELTLYVSGRPYNEKLTHQLELLHKVTLELDTRERGTVEISKAYYQTKTDDIIKLTDDIRKTIGSEKL